MNEYTPSERLILMYLELAVLKGERGVTKKEIITGTGMDERTFKRAWVRLMGDDLVITENRITEKGRATVEKKIPTPTPGSEPDE